MWCFVWSMCCAHAQKRKYGKHTPRNRVNFIYLFCRFLCFYQSLNCGLLTGWLADLTRFDLTVVFRVCVCVDEKKIRSNPRIFILWLIFCFFDSYLISVLIHLSISIEISILDFAYRFSRLGSDSNPGEITKMWCVYAASMISISSCVSVKSIVIAVTAS